MGLSSEATGDPLKVVDEARDLIVLDVKKAPKQGASANEWGMEGR